MYCVRCGVRLAEGVPSCPLCQTPVWNPEVPDRAEQPRTFSRTYPPAPKSIRYPILAFLTIFLMAVCLSVWIFCIKTRGAVSWSGLVMLGIALVYFSVIFPFWFEKSLPGVFVPLFFVLTCGYLLYINCYVGGHWFLSFAFPVVMVTGLLVTVGVLLYRHIKNRRLLITGGLFLGIGGACMLIELFESVSFHTRMFTWSLYPVCFFGLFGVFLLLAAFIRPLRAYLERKFFL